MARPPSLTSSKTVGFKQLILEKDADFAIRSQKLPEYEFTSNGRSKGDPNGNTGIRLFQGYYRSRGPYAP